jgi:hypothetical protein
MHFRSSKFVNYHYKKFVKFLSNQKLSSKLAHLHLSFGTFSYWIYVHFILKLLQSFYISGLWNFPCQKSELIWQDKRCCFFSTFSMCVWIFGSFNIWALLYLKEVELSKQEIGVWVRKCLFYFSKNSKFYKSYLGKWV